MRSLSFAIIAADPERAKVPVSVPFSDMRSISVKPWAMVGSFGHRVLDQTQVSKLASQLPDLVARHPCAVSL
jgi:hypothetical protein